MNEPNEREKKLINYIMLLIGALNTTMMFIASVYKNAEWMEKSLDSMNLKRDEDEMIDWLKSEFNLPLSIVLDKDVIQSK